MMNFKFEFLTHVPEKMEAGTLYISIPFSTAMHLCPCGCHNEVVTKISPDRWRFTFDGESVSLYPSIGNWSLPCRSHYWIRNNRIVWAENWSPQKVLKEREKEKKKKKRWPPRF